MSKTISSGEDGLSTMSILKKQEQFLWPSHILYYRDPLPLDHGKGSYVTAVDGTEYLDYFGGILTTSVGHNHPRIIEKVTAQIGKIIHCSTLYPHENHVQLAEKIAEIAPGRLEKSYFTNSGTEADELAVMAARGYTGNFDILALRHGYSGNSAMGKTLTAQSAWRLATNIVPGIKHAINPYCYRCPFKMSFPSCDLACAQDVEEVIKTTTCGRVAGMLVEPIQGVGGFVTPPPGYFSMVAEIVRHYGGVMIADEVQTGFGRTGNRWFGIEHWEVEPEIMTMAKGIANGFPMGNTITTPEIADSLVGKGHFICTFGGNPVSTMASIATIEVMTEECPPSVVAEKGELLRKALERMAENSPIIGEVRGMGLMQGIEIVTDKTSKTPAPELVVEIFEATKAKGLLIGKGGMFNNVIRLTPPLNTTETELDTAIAILNEVFTQLQ
ncbi:aspartate aminotransferase family protein [Desulfopila aestuarii]|uniref:alanine--glyoxylate transaminase n=1 Tax=Desulfopila aestuarii DSM 18488 TaxID=1121416 RepID=A0A1M7XWA7_9BACT|nr:aspartate aminotransferase family protein [Desulfopila aestuarii]SHO43053.1 4-aminobutyrate aminotransferase [Desulfopila aestuarii DSM 18488]